MAAPQIVPQPDLSAVPAAGSYALDHSHSHVAFSARHLMVTKTRGRFPVVDGKLVENLHVENARRLVALDEAIRELEAQAA